MNDADHAKVVEIKDALRIGDPYRDYREDVTWLLWYLTKYSVTSYTEGHKDGYNEGYYDGHEAGSAPSAGRYRVGDADA